VKRAIAGGALAVGLSITGAGSATAATVPVIYVNAHPGGGSNFVHGKVRPHGNLYWTCDGSGWFTLRSWSGWSASNAWGKATTHLRSGPVTSPARTSPSTLHLYRVRTHDGQRYFTRLHFTLTRPLFGVRSGTLRAYQHGCSAWYY
jgi:hypothetical protein